jgi:hypothetical protein
MRASLHAYALRMHEIAKWGALLLIAVVAVSPIFEVFDKTDGWAQDTSDLARYVLCLFCFLAFSLRGTVIASGLAAFCDRIIGPTELPQTESKFRAILLQGTKDRGLFLAFHDLRI